MENYSRGEILMVHMLLKLILKIGRNIFIHYVKNATVAVKKLHLKGMPPCYWKFLQRRNDKIIMVIGYWITL